VAIARVKPVNVPLFMTPWGLVMRHTRRVAESRFYPIPLRGWHAGALEPEIFEEHLRLAFDRGSIVELVSMFSWAADRKFGGSESDFVERFEKMDIPLLVVAGANDDLAPPASVRPAYARSASRDKTYRAVPLGHIDLLVGRDAPKLTWEVVTRWLTKRAGQPRGASIPPSDVMLPDAS
jgi:polyhydroxyalkanoate synthase